MIRHRLRRCAEGLILSTATACLCILAYANPNVSSVDTNQPTTCTPVTATPYAGVTCHVTSVPNGTLHNTSSQEDNIVDIVGATEDLQEEDLQQEDSQQEDNRDEETHIEETRDEEQSSQSTTTDEYSTSDEEIIDQNEEQEEPANTEVNPSQVSDESDLSTAINNPNSSEDNEEISNTNAVTEDYSTDTTSCTYTALNRRNGRVDGPSGEETFYNLNMSGCVNRMHDLGYDYEYWVREDGVKMFGPYVMVAADFNSRPLGTVLETTLGTGVVVDTGTFAESNPGQLDIATSW